MAINRSLATEFLLVALPKILNGVGLVVINVIASQMLGPTLFGVFYVCFAAVLLVDGVVGSAFDMAVLRLVPTRRDQQPDQARNIETAALLWKTGLATLVTLVLATVAGPLSETAFGLEDGETLVYLSCAAAIALLALRSLQVHLQVQQRFATYGGFDLLVSLLRIAGAVAVLLFLPGTPASFLAVLVIAPTIALVTAATTVGRSLFRVGPGFGRASAELVSVVKWLLMTFSITTVAAKLDLWLLTAWSTMKSVGLFSAAQVLTMIPELLGMYLSVVISPKIMPAIKDGSFPALFRRLQIGGLLIAVGSLVIGLAGLGLVQQLSLAGQYQRSVTILAILLPGALLSMINFPLVVPTLMFVKPKVLIRIELTLLAPLIIFYYLAITHYDAEGAAVVTTLGRTLKAVWQSWTAWKCCSDASSVT